MEEKFDQIPKTLYRGYNIKYKKLPNFHLSGVDLKVNYAPIINENGEKTVTDGNEYGVYMSDNLDMVKSAYGNTKMARENVEPLVSINNGTYLEQMMLPVISIIYEINPDGLAVRKPKIAPIWQGHYNNGFRGDEYITDKIPADHYQVIQAKIGSDLLHEAEEIDVTDIKKAEEELKQKAELRRYRLEALASYLTKLPPNKIFNTRGVDKDILRTIFGENGIRYINPNQLNFNNNDNTIKSLYYYIFNKSGLMDMKSLRLIAELNRKLNSDDLNITTLITQEITNLQTKNKIFKEKKGSDNPNLIATIATLENFQKLIIGPKRPYLKPEVMAIVKERDSYKEENMPTSPTKEQLILQKEKILAEKQRRQNEQDLKLQQDTMRQQKIQEEIMEEEQGLSM